MKPEVLDLDDVRHLFQVFFEKSENELKKQNPEMTPEEIRKVVLEVVLESYEEYK